MRTTRVELFLDLYNVLQTIRIMVFSLMEVPTVEVLICTFNDSIDKVIKMLPEPEVGVTYLVSHQVSDNNNLHTGSTQYRQLSAREDVKISTLYGIGLSKNRNNALSKASGDILVIMDDDVTFLEGWSDKVRREFNTYSDAELITFRITTPQGQLFKNYGAAGRKHTKLSIFKVSSIEVAFRKEAWLRSGVFFDVNYGLNAKFRACEESVFLADLLKKAVTLRSSDQVIAVHPKESSGGNYSNPASCAARGAVIRRVFGILGFPLVVLFSIKHYPEFKEHHSFLGFVRLAGSGFFSPDA